MIAIPSVHTDFFIQFPPLLTSASSGLIISMISGVHMGKVWRETYTIEGDVSRILNASVFQARLQEHPVLLPWSNKHSFTGYRLSIVISPVPKDAVHVMFTKNIGSQR